MSDYTYKEADRRLRPDACKTRRIQRVLLSLMLIWSLAFVPTEMDMSNPHGWAFSLESRLVIEDYSVSTSGDWSFLAVTGRPKHVSELMVERLRSTDASTKPNLSIIGGSLDQRPANSEPYAALTGLRIAGIESAGVDARVDFWGVSNSRMLRNLSTGRSHGLMIALLAYESVTSEDLARGRHIAGTGGVNDDGSVRSVGYVEAKVEAADRAGADIVFVPSSKLGAIDDIELANATVVGVYSIEEAVEYLRE